MSKNSEIPKNGHILKDEIIRLTGTKADEKCPPPLRRIEVYNPEKDEILVFLTNTMKLSATTIAALYKDLWQIELFFKALKQNLKIKTFVGTSANAVKIQIWTALIAMLILKYLQLNSEFAWSLSNLMPLDIAGHGDPTQTTDYALCFGDDVGTPVEILVPAGQLWSEVAAEGYRYSDGAGSNAGLQRVGALASGGSKSKISDPAPPFRASRCLPAATFSSSYTTSPTDTVSE